MKADLHKHTCAIRIRLYVSEEHLCPPYSFLRSYSYRNYVTYETKLRIKDENYMNPEPGFQSGPGDSVDAD